jgi:HemY protein
MRRFIFLLFILIISVFVGLKIAEDPGYALFAYKQWTVEMPLWFAVFSLILMIAALFLVLRFFDGIDASWSKWRSWLWMRRKHKAYSKTNRGLIELLEANWKSAENYLMDGVDQSDAPLINFLAAAKAAHEQGAFDKRDIYLRKAYDLSPQSHIAVGLTQAQLQLSQGKLEQALATLNQLRQIAPKQRLILKLLERVYIHLGDWKNLLNLTPHLYKAKLITADQMILLESKIYQELLIATSKSGSVNAARELWRVMPRKIQKRPDVVCCYVKQLFLYPEMLSEIEELIVKTLKYDWQEECVRIYGLLVTTHTVKQLKIAEDWQKHYGMHAMLYLTLARLSARCQMWGKARSYYEECVKLTPLSEAYLEYGDLLLQLDEISAAMQVFREGLQ